MSTVGDKLQETLTQLKKRYGAAITTGADIAKFEMERASTGSFALDMETGGGLPFGRISELYGLEGSGKTTLALKTVASVQKLGKSVVWIDAEGAFDATWAALLGVNIKELTLARPQTAEECGDILVAVVQSGECGMVVLDSIGSMMPALEQEKSMVDDNQKVGGLPMIVTRLMKRTNSSLNSYDAEGGFNDCLVLLLNQVREDLKIQYGNPQVAPGGHALRHFCSIIIRLTRSEWLEEEVEGGDKLKIGHAIKFLVEKNKTFPPRRTSQFNFYFDGALKAQVDTVEEIMRYGQLRGVVEVSGRTYKYGDTKTVGKDGFLALMRSDPKMVEKMRKEILAVVKK